MNEKEVKETLAMLRVAIRKANESNNRERFCELKKAQRRILDKVNDFRYRIKLQ